MQQVGSTGEDLGLGVVTDALGNAYWTGCFYRQATFDTIAVNSFNNSTYQDVFVARSEPAGGVAFVTTAGGGSDERATAIDKRTDGPLVIGGQYVSWNCQFGDITLPQGGRCFVASMAVPDDDFSTSVAKNPAPTGLRIYPVPATDELFIAMSGGRGALDVQICDMTGQVVRQTFLGAPFGSIDITGLSTGSYILKCTDGGGLVQMGRAVVVRGE